MENLVVRLESTTKGAQLMDRSPEYSGNRQVIPGLSQRLVPPGRLSHLLL